MTIPCHWCWRGPVDLQGTRLKPRDATVFVRTAGTLKPTCPHCLENGMFPPETIPTTSLEDGMLEYNTYNINE